jgi:hypothetical protein
MGLENKKLVAVFSQFASLAQPKSAQHSVHPTGGSLRVFEPFVWLEVGSSKRAFSRPAHQRVTPAVGRQMTSNKIRPKRI